MFGLTRAITEQTSCSALGLRTIELKNDSIEEKRTLLRRLQVGIAVPRVDLSERPQKERLGLFAWIAQDEIGKDADDLKCVGILGPVQPETLPQRILVLEEPLYKCLIDEERSLYKIPCILRHRTLRLH